MANFENKTHGQLNNNQEKSSPGKMPNLASYPYEYLMPVTGFFRQMDRLFENALSQFNSPLIAQNFSAMRNALIPSVDMAASDHEYVIKIEIPGIAEKDISLNIAGNILSISGEKKQENQDKGQNMHSAECCYGKFSREIALPLDVAQEAIEATVANGVLTLICPKLETRKIQINAKTTADNQKPNSASNAERSADKNNQQNFKKSA